MAAANGKLDQATVANQVGDLFTVLYHPNDMKHLPLEDQKRWAAVYSKAVTIAKTVGVPVRE